MRIACISDTHLFHETTKPDLIEAWTSSLKHCDAIFHAGDATYKGTRDEIKAFSRWFSSLTPEIKIFVAGNHDIMFERDRLQAQSYLDKSIIYLQDEEVTIKGKRIWGSPATPWFYDWAFNYARGAHIKSVWDKIPDGLDFLITHGPAAGYGCYMNKGGGQGCHDLLAAIDKCKPLNHLCGHFHMGYGVYYRNSTRIINAAALNDKYQLAHMPIIVEI